MPKKQRTPRRRKVNGIDAVEAMDSDLLSESYTVISEDFSLADTFDEGFKDEETFEDMIDNSVTVSSRHSKLLDSLSLASTLTSEKSPKKREQGLRTLFKAITQYTAGDSDIEYIRSRLEDTILPLCKTCLKGGTSSEEQYASCRVLEATSILLGGDEHDFAEGIYTLLSRVVKVTSRAMQARGAALNALAMAFFICASEVNSSDKVLDLCEQVSSPEFRGEPVPSILRATALNCWALLSTTLHDEHLAGDDIKNGEGRGLIFLPLLSDCLNSTNLNLRCAAGECVALIHEARLDLGLDSGEDNNASDRRYCRGSWHGSESESLIDEIKFKIEELSVESGKQLSKKVKKYQKQRFREIMATVLNDEPPNEILTLRGGQLSLTNWKEIIQLNFIRHCLQSGFQIQLMTNSTLQLIFEECGVAVTNSSNISQLEKRLLMSKASSSSKKAYKERSKRRKSRIRAQNLFLNAD